MVKALCFDQSTTNTGWAAGDENGSPKPGSNSPLYSGVIQTPKREEFGERLAFIYRQAMILVETHKPDIIGFEEPYFPHQGAGGGKPKYRKGGGQSEFIHQEPEEEGPKDGGSRFNPDMLKKLQMVKGIIITVAALRSLPVAPCHPSQWRVTFLGYGRKPQGEAEDYMKRAVKRRAEQLGHAPSGYDEADAIGILYHTLHGKQAMARTQGDLLSMAGSSL